MGLVNLKTDLKSLKYGNDRPGGGSSNQPYIVTPIPDGLTANGPDFLLRQGALKASLTDISRLTKWFSDTQSVNGLLFTTKQIALERQNPKLVNTNRIYLPTSTISQVGALAVGSHFNKQGLDPLSPLSYFAGGTEGYYFTTRGIGEYPTFQTLPNGEIENRLTIAYTAKIANQSLGGLAINPFGITTLNPTTLLSYSGGPNAVLGLGSTNIRIQNPTIKLKDVYEDGEARTAEIYNNPNNVSALEGQNFLSHKIPTWIYNPSYKNPGASFEYQVYASENGVDDGYLFRQLYNDNISNILNRDTTTIYNKPLGNTGVSINYVSTDPSKPGYLTPKGEKGNVAPTNNYNIDQIMSVGASQNYFDIYKDKLGEGGGFRLLSTEPKEIVERNSATSPIRFPEFREEATTKIEYTNNTDPTKPDYLVPKTISVEKIYNPTSSNNNTTSSITTTLAFLHPSYNIKKNGEPVPPPYPDIEIFNREDTYKAMPTVYKNSRTRLSNDTIKSDRINETDIVNSSTASLDNISLPNVDITKFFFEINNNDSSTDNFFLFFRAYINNLSDSFQSTWQDYKYVGRGENFYRYSGFSRDMSLSFTIYAHSRAEMIPLYNKLNYLAGATAPDYSDAGYMRGNFINITVGDYINSMPSIIKNISLKPSFEAGWDINRKEDNSLFTSADGNLNVGQVPRMIEVDLSFTPLHNFTPQFGKDFIRQVSLSPQIGTGVGGEKTV
jgi:hypothetical protein